MSILAEADDQFEQKVSASRGATGTKAEQARDYLLQEAPAEFRFAEANAALPGISSATLRQVLNALREEGKLVADRGPKAVWRRADGS